MVIRGIHALSFGLATFIGIHFSELLGTWRVYSAVVLIYRIIWFSPYIGLFLRIWGSSLSRLQSTSKMHVTQRFVLARLIHICIHVLYFQKCRVVYPILVSESVCLYPNLRIIDAMVIREAWQKQKMKNCSIHSGKNIIRFLNKLEEAESSNLKASFILNGLCLQYTEK